MRETKRKKKAREKSHIKSWLMEKSTKQTNQQLASPGRREDSDKFRNERGEITTDRLKYRGSQETTVNNMCQQTGQPRRNKQIPGNI